MKEKMKQQKRIEITQGIELIDHALWIPAHKLLAISDTHIGYEEALNKKGILVPRFGFGEMQARVKKIVEEIKKQTDIKIILVNGDLKHEFGTISDQEWRETLQFLDVLTAQSPEVIIVKGNHDTIIGPIARKREVKLVDYFIDNGGDGIETYYEYEIGAFYRWGASAGSNACCNIDNSDADPEAGCYSNIIRNSTEAVCHHKRYSDRLSSCPHGTVNVGNRGWPR